MARLCVRILDNSTGDPELDALRTHPGDVVCITEDDHKFSDGELNCGHYRIIDLPGVPAAEVMHLCEHIQDAEGKLIKRRKRGLNVKSLHGVVTKEHLAAITIDRA